MSSSDPAVGAPPPRGAFVKRFWRGEVPLGISFWLVYILASIVFGKTLRGLEDAFLRGATFDPRVLLAVVAGGILVGVPLSVWQYVGVWRAAGAYRAARRQDGKRALLSYLARAMVVFGAASLFYVLATRSRPELVEYARMAFLGDPDIPDYGFRAMRDGAEVEIVGGIKFGLTRDFEAFVADKPRLRVIHLDSLGGRVGEAKHLYAMIRARGLETYVADGCYSACTLAFAAGVKRWLGPGGKLGFHASSFAGVAQDDQVDVEARLYEAAGIAPAFVARALATRPSDIWTPTRQELLDAHVVTDLATDDTFADSGTGLALTEAAWAARLRKRDPKLAALAVSQPDLFAPLAAASLAAYRDGRSQRAVTRILRDGLDSAFATMLPDADDATLLDLARLAVDEFTALQARRPEDCYLYGSGKKHLWDLAAVLNPEIVRREGALELRVLSTRAPRAEATKDAAAAATDRYQELIKAADPGDDVGAVEEAPHTPAGYATYCRVTIMAFKVAARMDPPAAGIVLHEMLLAK